MEDVDIRPPAGFVKIYRAVWRHPAFRNHGEAGVFVWMICTAQWRDVTIRTKHGPVDLRRGELIVAQRALATAFGLNRNAIRALFHRLNDEGIIATSEDRQTTKLGTIVRINNYEKYQSLEDTEDEADTRNSPADPPANLPATHPQLTQEQESKRPFRNQCGMVVFGVGWPGET